MQDAGASEDDEKNNSIKSKKTAQAVERKDKHGKTITSSTEAGTNPDRAEKFSKSES